MIPFKTTDDNDPANMVTAAVIAHCLEVSPQATRKRLRDVPASEVRCIAGNQETSVWSFRALPEKLRADLENVARRRGYRWAEEMLGNPPTSAPVDFKLSEICQKDISYATKLRAALKVALALQSNVEIKSSEIESAACLEFQKQFDYPVTERHLRALLKRALERDGGLENWDRLQLYLPDNPRQKEQAQAARIDGEVGCDFVPIQTYINDLPNPKNPDKEDYEIIWEQAFCAREVLIGKGLSGKEASREVRSFLHGQCPFRELSRDALLKSFERKLSAYSADEPFDKRINNTGNPTGYVFPEADFICLVRLAKDRGGRIRQAWRFGLLNKLFTHETQTRYFGKAKSKSHIPKWIAELVRPQVEHEMKLIEGKRTTGYVQGDYSKLSSFATISGDDMTGNNLVWLQTETGFKMIQGQFLIFICVRSLCVLHWCFIPKESYNSLAIRSSLVKIFEQFGAPDTLHFEYGIWKNSKLITGSNERNMHEVTRGMRKFGIEFQHATSPEAKGCIENVIGRLQTRTEIERGYKGRTAMLDCPVATKKQLDAVMAGRAHPSEYFYSCAEWNDRFKLIVDDYNNEVQQGEIIPGLSPLQALEKFKPVSDPRIGFPPSLRYLLTYHTTETTCTANGVTITLNGERLNYKGAAIAHFTGHRVILMIDPENPEKAIITDRDGTPESIAEVERSQKVNRYAKSDEDRLVLSKELRRVKEQVAPNKTMHNTLKVRFNVPKRLTLPDGDTIERGRRIKKIEQGNVEKNRLAKDDARETARLGLGVPLMRVLTEQQIKEVKEIE